MMIELLTGLDPVAVRELIDESLFEELPEMIRQHHDAKVEPEDESSAGAVEEGNQEKTRKKKPPTPKCTWPDAPLQQLSTMAAKCVRKEAKRRVTIADVLPELEELPTRLSGVPGSTGGFRLEYSM
jgi:hypothetical protein